MRLTHDFWKANKHKACIPRRSFSLALSKLRNYPTKAPDEHLCSEFLSIITEEFTLQVEGCTDVLRHANVFEWWCSGNPNDCVFGSLGPFVNSDLAGKNVFAFPDPCEVADVIGRH